MEKKYWKNVPDELLNSWQEIYEENREGAFLSVKCPICGQEGLRRHYQAGKPIDRTIGECHYVARGGEWQWCSACRHYEHMQAWVPDWWTCELEFDESILTAVPNVLDMLYQNPQKVNKWKRISQEDLERWHLAFAEESSTIKVEGSCPICNEQQLYHYYALQRNEPVKFKKRWYKGQGAYWQWCSACYHYQYRHWVYVPMEWEESMVIEAEELMVIPEPLNEAVKSIM